MKSNRKGNQDTKSTRNNQIATHLAINQKESSEPKAKQRDTTKIPKSAKEKLAAGYAEFGEEEEEEENEIENEIEVSDEDEKALSQTGYIEAFTSNAGGKLAKGFEWKEIPMLAVITGENGIGKTAVLEHILLGFEKLMLNKPHAFKLYTRKVNGRKSVPQINSFSSA